MKYTIPYDDKITLPHIKKIDSIGINADNLNYDQKELLGEVIISGEYLLDNSKDIMEFSHDIPVSFLIDDETISPHVNISNFKYELIPGRGIEVMFDLDVILSEITEEEKESIARSSKKSNHDKELIAENIEEDEKDKSDEEEIKKFQNKIDNDLDGIINSRNDADDTLELEPIEDNDIDDFEFNTNLMPTMESFDTSFVPRDNDKFTTYKILLVEDNENIDELLEARNLPKALICNEYKFDKKIVLKIENEQF